MTSCRWPCFCSSYRLVTGNASHARRRFDRAKTQEFRERLSSGGSFDDVLEEAFAVVREAAWRVLELRHYDVQVLFLFTLPCLLCNLWLSFITTTFRCYILVFSCFCRCFPILVIMWYSHVRLRGRYILLWWLLIVCRKG